jgi:hypothetical protein
VTLAIYSADRAKLQNHSFRSGVSLRLSLPHVVDFVVINRLIRLRLIHTDFAVRTDGIEFRFREGVDKLAKFGHRQASDCGQGAILQGNAPWTFNAKAFYPDPVVYRFGFHHFPFRG